MYYFAKIGKGINGILGVILCVCEEAQYTFHSKQNALYINKGTVFAYGVDVKIMGYHDIKRSSGQIEETCVPFVYYNVKQISEQQFKCLKTILDKQYEKQGMPFVNN